MDRRSWYLTATIGNDGETLFNVIVVGSLVAILPLIAAFPLFQRYRPSGPTMGSLR